MRKKLIFAAILFIAALSISFILGFSLRQEQQEAQNTRTPSEMPATVQKFSVPTPQDLFAKDAEVGSSGNVNVRLEEDMILWPEKYALRSLEIVNLGTLSEASDNSTVWKFAIRRNDEQVLSPLRMGERIPFADLLEDIFYDPLQRPGTYAIKGAFYNENNPSEIAEGVYVFQTNP